MHTVYCTHCLETLRGYEHSALCAQTTQHAHSSLQELLALLCSRFNVRFGVKGQLVLGFEFGLGIGFALNAYSKQHALLPHGAVPAHSPLHALLARSGFHP